MRMSILCDWYVWQWCTSVVSASALQPNTAHVSVIRIRRPFSLFHTFDSKISRIRGNMIRKAASEFRIILCCTVWNKMLLHSLSYCVHWWSYISALSLKHTVSVKLEAINSSGVDVYYHGNDAFTTSDEESGPTEPTTFRIPTPGIIALLWHTFVLGK